MLSCGELYDKVLIESQPMLCCPIGSSWVMRLHHRSKELQFIGFREALPELSLKLFSMVRMNVITYSSGYCSTIICERVVLLQ